MHSHFQMFDDIPIVTPICMTLNSSPRLRRQLPVGACDDYIEEAVSHGRTVTGDEVMRKVGAERKAGK